MKELRCRDAGFDCDEVRASLAGCTGEAAQRRRQADSGREAAARELAGGLCPTTA